MAGFKKILVVDDSPSMRNIITGQLKQAGFSDIDQAEDGVQALEKLEAEVFDMILTDWNMPHMDGLELVRAIRSHEYLQHLPILVVTTRNTKNDVVAAIKEGANNYVVKPFGPEILKAKIANFQTEYVLWILKQHDY